jgi:hypothetical protein
MSGEAPWAEPWEPPPGSEFHRGRDGVAYSWINPGSRCTRPIWHANRPAPTPGCGCESCHRPRCCGVWAEPVDLILTAERVAWICPDCLELVCYDIAT